jgi:1-acyl-sn-glycerol-3-phosphate acyltransferase
MPLRYRIARRLLRIWFAAVFRRIRLLGAEDEAASGTTVLLVGNPPRILDLLLLVASFDRQLHCLIDAKTAGPLAARFLSWSLGVIVYTSGVDAPYGVGIEECRELLESKGTVVVFANPEAKCGNASERLTSVARIALEVESSSPSPVESAILAVHLLIPFARFNEALIHFGEPVFPQDFLALPGCELDQQVIELARVLSQVCHVNPFALQQHDLVQLLADLAEVLRSDLADEWANRPNWKQTVEGFTLSRFLTEWAEQTNRLDPDELLTLRQALNACREARRRWSLETIEIENAEWTRSTLRRAVAWLESALGLPVACYGFLNHLAPGLLVSLTGVGKKPRRQVRPREWALAALLVLACYAGAIALVNHWFGRSTAGYYAVTLPTSGLYLWRYTWLWRHRTRLLLQDLVAPLVESRLRRMRKELIARVGAARNAYADVLAVAH